jgi:hypothetical protein
MYASELPELMKQQPISLTVRVPPTVTVLVVSRSTSVNGTEKR